MKMKTFTYSIMHFCVAFIVSFALTGDIGIAGAIALVEPLVQTFAYFIHEKAWQNYSQNKMNCKKQEYKFSFSHLFIHSHS